MRKTLVIIFAIAILGGLSFVVTNNKSKNNVTASPQSEVVHTATPNSNKSTVSNNSSLSYKDGTYTGNVADTPYGPVQIAAVISGGKITDINFLEMPTDDFVSGATSTSYGYQESLQAALDKAHNS
jgi:uncharacterized protein with FMN-binding domain